jgi:O-antigen/teichoic acid export membrane protein
VVGLGGEGCRNMGMPGGGVSAVQPEGRTVSRLLARGSLWSGLGFTGTQLVRFGGNLILWRLLFEEAFGVMALATVFMTGLQMFSDVGIGPSLIQNRREDDSFVNTAWTLQIIRGVLIWAVACAGAYPLAQFYEQPVLLEVIPVVGFTAVINGFNSSNIFGEQRQVELRRVALLDLGSQLVATLAMVAWALVHPSVWALAVGGIVGSCLKMAGSHRCLPGRRNRLRWEPDAVGALVRFGRWIFLSTILTFFALQSDRLVFGKLVPIAVLGVYSIAQIYATLPSQLSAHVVGTVVFPALSRERHAGADMHASFRQVRLPILMGAAFLVACLVAGGPTLIAFLYDARAADAGWIIQILAAGSWFIVLEAVNGAALLACGHPRAVAFAHGAKVLGMGVTIPLGYALWGFPGAIIGFAAADVLKYAVAAYSVTRLSLGSLGQDMALTAALAASVGAGLLARELVRRVDGPTLVEGLATLLTLASFWGVGWLAHRRLPRLGYQPFG